MAENHPPTSFPRWLRAQSPLTSRAVPRRHDAHPHIPLVLHRAIVEDAPARCGGHGGANTTHSGTITRGCRARNHSISATLFTWGR
jgi:hypothetical protein